jgi:hypothetical protein
LPESPKFLNILQISAENQTVVVSISLAIEHVEDVGFEASLNAAPS